MNETSRPILRSMLFVSGERPERFAKAMSAGADLVCIDLEDAVAPTRKAEARRAAVAWLSERTRDRACPAVALRINGVRTLEGLRDVLALAEAGVAVDWLLLPKVEDAADVQCLDAWTAALPIRGLVALIETAQGIEHAAPIARAGGRLGALMLGGADLSADLGATFDWAGLQHARGRLVNAARAAGLQAWDVPHIDLGDAAALVDETRRVIALGYDCKTAIHPQQIAAIHGAFAPSADEVAWATALIDATPPGGASGAFLFQGRMVDAPVLRRAHRVRELARLTATTAPTSTL